ncbi:c-type cytochrome [Microbulbifer variabilis]|uniref:c-type cytochrome n=1 Tax=Microbulbifer variabilis TaxID=266805 RepID=UPI000382C91C|nr:c-type cytochrome [Microbulbifer variabilis]
MELVSLRRSFGLVGIFLILALLTSGCSKSPESTVANRAALGERALSLTPADSDLAEIYIRTCRSCHGTGASAAPLTGDLDNWKPRMDKGMDILVDNAINGFQGMPPLGLCFECSPEQFEQLIAFMATAE